MTYCTQISSPIGFLRLTSDGKSLTGLYLDTHNPQDATWGASPDLAIFDFAAQWLSDYFAGKHRPVDLPLAPSGTEFQRKVWQLLLTIPYGETTTYGAIAKLLGQKMSAQAVGQAVGKNPIAIIIPCHRVVGSGGQLTGYAWGIEKKQWLLTHEEETK